MNHDMSGPYVPVVEHMNQAMMATWDPNLSRDYALKMIALRQGTIDMSEILLQNSLNPQLRAMASRTIQDSRRDIQQLRLWLRRNDGVHCAASTRHCVGTFRPEQVRPVRPAN